MHDAQRDDGGTQLEQAQPPGPPATVGVPDRAATRRPAWAVFLGIGLAVLVVDQLTKAWIVATIEPGRAIRLVGDYLRLINSQNTGGLFGLFGSAAPVFATVSLVVIALIVWYHGRSDRSLLLSVALGLLFGGAIGNLVDRLRYGFVVDWVDAGIGDLRWWTFNVGDAGISVAILLLLALALRPASVWTARDG